MKLQNFQLDTKKHAREASAERRNYALIFGGGFTRLPNLILNAMRYSLRSDFTSNSRLGAEE
jgi:hypothetical protein